MFKITGTIKVLNPTVQVSEKFSKREFVLTENLSQYPQDVLFQAVQDRCALLDGINVGEQVEVSFNLRGREWTSPQGEVKYFNSLDAWRIEKVGQGMPAGGPSNMDLNAVPSTNTVDALLTTNDETDDLPF
ncbi:MAG: DUF3127 domain-containing protein [Bacteroidota bacterium]